MLSEDITGARERQDAVTHVTGIVMYINEYQGGVPSVRLRGRDRGVLHTGRDSIRSKSGLWTPNRGFSLCAL